jgi:cytochrome c7-like protein
MRATSKVRLAIVPWMAASTVIGGCTWIDDRTPPPKPAPYTANAAAASRVFTPAHPTFRAAARDFFGIRPVAVQPFAFPHRTHVEEGLTCTEVCHASAPRGPRAGLPSVRDCLSCHDTIAAESPLIQQITALADRGFDFEWQRVYGFGAQAHVRFNHAPHLRAAVGCATCHGEIGLQSVAQRTVDLNMGFCVGCHRSKGAPTDCLTCHF